MKIKIYYIELDIEWVRLIKKAKMLGFTSEDIRTILGKLKNYS